MPISPFASSHTVLVVSFFGHWSGACTGGWVSAGGGTGLTMAMRAARGQAAAWDCQQEQRRPWRWADGCGGKARAITIWVGGEPSSLRAELGSIDKALELAPVDKDL